MTDRAPRSGEEPVVNALTIDVEDYFHVSVFDGLVPRSEWASMDSRVCANTERLLDIIGDTKGTFFVLGWVAERHPALIRTISAGGHEIASHGYAHRLVYDQTPDAFRADVRRAKALLEDAAGVEVVGYRAPSYSITPQSLWALDILIEEGYRYDASVFPIRHDRYGIPVSPRHPYLIDRPAGTILEAPGSTTRLGPLNLPVAGGGYFRILPYGWTKWGIDRVNRIENRPAIFYLHPWEVDPDQPRLQAGTLGKFRHYRNLHQTEARLRQLLTDFNFAPLARVLRHCVDSKPIVSAAWALPYLW
jgi:polysaccharide deacetylase family protein (PEP-CTERM system associated)